MQADQPQDWWAPRMPPATRAADRCGCRWRSAAWTAAALAELATAVTAAAEPLAALPAGRLLAAWGETVDAFLDPGSRERRILDGPLARLTGLSPQGLDAGLAAVLGGVRRSAAAELIATAAQRKAPAGGPRPPTRSAPTAPALVILAANLPALAVQPLLPALALRRPVILKSPSAEPLFAPAFAAALARREPALGRAVAAVTWQGGDSALEAPLLAAAGRVVAYGEAETLADLERRASGRVLGYGPKTSLAAVAAGVEPRAVAPGLARDVALFDQRGCLSVAAVYAGGGEQQAEELARELARELAALARRWPPGPLPPPQVAAVQQLRAEAELRGLSMPEMTLAAGTVVVEPRPEMRPTPGLRTVRIHPLTPLSRLPEVLAPWAGRLQGAALAGSEAEALVPALARLGVSRTAAPGELQSPDATWHNGGVNPLEALR